MNKEIGKLLVNVTEIEGTLTIFLSGSFIFQAHRDFKAAYQEALEKAAVSHIVVDFANVEYLDSSALGMLLVLKDKVEKAQKALTLTRPNLVTVQTFEIAGFDKIFKITAKLA